MYKVKVLNATDLPVRFKSSIGTIIDVSDNWAESVVKKGWVKILSHYTVKRTSTPCSTCGKPITQTEIINEVQQ